MVFGQGGPTREAGHEARDGRWAGEWLTRQRWKYGLWAAVAWAAVAGQAAAEMMRVRLEWGGGAEQVWEGKVSTSRGSLAQPVPLGIEADEPGSIWTADGAMMIRQRSPRTYDGVDVLVDAPLDDSLTVQLATARMPNPVTIRVPLSDLLNDFYSGSLDNQGNRLLVRRSPGDKLPVTFERRSLVFAPGEVFKIEIHTHLLPLPADSKAKLHVQLVEGRGSRATWSADHTAKAGQAVAVPMNIPLPNQEGIYEVVITAAWTAWQRAVRAPLQGKTVAERRIQVMVIDPRPVGPGGPAGELSRVVEVDPTTPRWWERLGGERSSNYPKLAALNRMRRGPLGSGHLEVRQHALGPVAQLGTGRGPADVSWEAYSLPINRPGIPHILEVEYPSDVPQAMGISILEPNSAGALTAVGLDSGVDVAPTAVDGKSPRWLRHRLIFWPRTKLPMVLITNRGERGPAVYGKIRVMAGWEQLPRAFATESPPSERLMAAYFDRPLLTRSFSADDALDEWSGRSLEDWVTFYESGRRLVEYLQHVGYNGLMISVLADGSTIYPSVVMQPTPRYDTGTFFDTAQDPVRKDVLEMLLRLFDREQLRLIPALDFSSPLPALEEIRRRGGMECEGLEWMGAEGGTWCQVNGAQRGSAPYYNVLDPRVQEAMLAVMREVIREYAVHPSFAGLAIHLSADGYAQLPGPDWGLDDVTIARFERDTKQSVGGRGPTRFAERARILAADPLHRIWLQWRADELNKFYRRVYDELSAVRPGSRVYLTGANMLSGADLQYELRPALPHKATLAETLLHVGIDPRHYQEDRGVVLFRAEQVVPSDRLSAQAVNLEIQQMPDVDRVFQDFALRGSVFFHQPQRIHLSSFDEKSPFRPTYADLATELVPSDNQNRQRFVHSLAQLDPQAMFDGGWQLPFGQEGSVASLIDVYRRLPATRFERLTDANGAEPSRPVTIRYANHAGRTWAYLVNDAPFAMSVRVNVEAQPEVRIEELTGNRRVAPLVREGSTALWSVDLGPYDVVGVRLSESGVKLSHPVVTPAREVESQLADRIRALGARAAMLGNPPALNVLRNPGFEQPGTEGHSPGWVLAKEPPGSTQIDSSTAQSGSRSLRLSSNGPATFVASESFEAPLTGRFSMKVWMRVADMQRQPPLRLAVEGKLQGEDYYRYAPIGLIPETGQSPVPISNEWTSYVFQVNDLPLEGLSQVRVRFDLLGPGEVWMDEVQVFDLAFTKRERVELSKLIALADVKLQNGQVGDCLRLLEGYWPRFLERHVPLPPGTLPNESLADKNNAPAKRSPPPERSGWLDRWRGTVPKLRF